MGTGITIKINLAGQVGPPVKHVDKQVWSVDVSPIGAPKSEIMTRKIKHNDRGRLEAVRVLNISPQTVSAWKNGECPHWAESKVWRKLSGDQKLEAHVQRFDEGFGVNFE